MLAGSNIRSADISSYFTTINAASASARQGTGTKKMQALSIPKDQQGSSAPWISHLSLGLAEAQRLWVLFCFFLFHVTRTMATEGTSTLRCVTGDPEHCLNARGDYVATFFGKWKKAVLSPAACLLILTVLLKCSFCSQVRLFCKSQRAMLTTPPMATVPESSTVFYKDSHISLSTLKQVQYNHTKDWKSQKYSNCQLKE